MSYVVVREKDILKNNNMWNLKIKIFLLKAYTHLSLNWKEKKQNLRLPQMKTTLRTNNTTTIKGPVSSVIYHMPVNH